MTRLFGDTNLVDDQIAEVTQGIGFEQLPVQASAAATPSQIINETIGQFETIATQSTTGIGNAGKIKVNYGAGGTTTNSEFTVDALGNITTGANALGLEYRIQIDVRIGRSGAAGVSVPLIRLMYAADGVEGNAVQLGSTFSVEIDDPDTVWRESFDLDLAPAVGSLLFVEFARDESGNNSGDILAVQPSGTLAAWNPAASSRVTFIKRNLV